MNVLHEARVFYYSEVCWSYIHHYFIGSKTEACEDQSNLLYDLVGRKLVLQIITLNSEKVIH